MKVFSLISYDILCINVQDMGLICSITQKVIMNHVTYLQNNEEVLSLRKYRTVVVDILKLNDDSCISKK